MLYQKIPSGRFWIMPNDFFEKYKLNSRDFMVYCFLVSKKDKKGKSYMVDEVFEQNRMRMAQYAVTKSQQVESLTATNWYTKK